MTDKDDIDRMIESMVVDSPSTDSPTKEDQGCKKVCHTVCPGEESCSGWCLPLYIHIFLAVLQCATIMMMKVYHPRKRTYVDAPTTVKARYMTVCIVWNLFTGLLMYYLCKYCHQGWAWVVLLLPIIINAMILLLLVFAILYMRKEAKKRKST